MSPLKRRQVTGWPLAPVSCCCETLFAACTLFTLLVHSDNQPHKALLIVRGCRNPLSLVNQRLNEKHAHSASFFLSGHFTVDVRSGWCCLHADAVVHNFDLELIGLH